MARLGRVLSAAIIAGAGTVLLPVSVDAQSSTPRTRSATRPPVTQVARLATGTITGIVSDEKGGPLAGARVTAIGATMALAITDAAGRFVTETLPSGEYVLRAHLKGFAASQRAVVRVTGPESAAPQLQLRRLDATAGTSGTTDTAVVSRPIVSAGFPLPPADTPETPSTTADEKGSHPHSEMAWRLRHIKRSILKDRSNAIIVADNDVDFADERSFFGRAVGGAANFATSLFTDVPLSGEVNLLTTNTFAPGELFGGDARPHGVAYLSLGAPTPAGEWLVRAAMTEGDLASWIITGSFASNAGPSHSYSLGLSYGAQAYQGGNPAALAAMRDGSRNAGEVFAFDLWRVAPWLDVDYGARYARYGYIHEDRGLLSPRFGLTFKPGSRTKVSALVTQRMVVPGAEEFLPRAITGPALPPERTFAPFEGHELRVERARGLELLLEHQFDDAYVVGVRRIHQNVDDQLVTMFRVAPEGSPESVGHYYVGTAGAFDASGWGLRVSSPPSRRIRASIDYSVIRAQWTSRNESLGAFVPAAIRAETEDIHDITTSLESDIPETATRFFLLYRVNNAFTRSDDLSRPGTDARFEVQVNQELPFGVAGTK